MYIFVTENLDFVAQDVFCPYGGMSLQRMFVPYDNIVEGRPLDI
jgi:hypothetical protein